MLLPKQQGIVSHLWLQRRDTNLLRYPYLDTDNVSIYWPSCPVCDSFIFQLSCAKNILIIFRTFLKIIPTEIGKLRYKVMKWFPWGWDSVYALWEFWITQKEFYHFNALRARRTLMVPKIRNTANKFGFDKVNTSSAKRKYIEINLYLWAHDIR